MKTIIWATALTASLGINAATADHGQVKCGPLDTAQEYLKNQHGEMFYNEESGAFSFGIVQPFNPTAICPVDQGTVGNFHKKNLGDKL